jgi:hypothetical protein
VHPKASLLIVPAMLSVAATLPAAEPELKLSPIVYFQTRADLPGGTNTAGDDIGAGTEQQAENDTVDFYLRRARLGTKLSYGNWSGRILFAADNAGRNVNGATDIQNSTTKMPAGAQASGTAVTLYDAYGAYAIKGEGINHEIRVGLYQAAFNPDAYYSSGSFQFAANGITENHVSNRQVGVGYTLDHEMVDVMVDIQNVRTDDNAGQALDGDGLWISGRAVITGTGEWNIGKWQSSYAGAEGKGFAVGLEFATEDTAVGNPDTQEVTAYGIDVLLHMDGLTASAEYRGQSSNTGATGADDVDSTVYRIQAGYAFPVSEYFLEPAIRYGSYDSNTDIDDQAGNFGGSDYARASGDEIDVGLNLYISGHKHKLSMLYTSWSAEGGDADASIIRFQHQLSF